MMRGYILTALCAAIPGQAMSASDAPGEGVLCYWAIAAAAQQVGSRCPGQAELPLQSALDESVAALEAYVAANGMSPAEIVAFKHGQGMDGRLNAELCSGDTLQLYSEMSKGGPEAVRKATRDLTARPGKPSWGDCL
jgi:hypothetical protein